MFNLRSTFDFLSSLQPSFHGQKGHERDLATFSREQFQRAVFDVIVQHDDRSARSMLDQPGMGQAKAMMNPGGNEAALSAATDDWGKNRITTATWPVCASTCAKCDMTSQVQPKRSREKRRVLKFCEQSLGRSSNVQVVKFRRGTAD